MDGGSPRFPFIITSSNIIHTRRNNNHKTTMSLRKTIHSVALLLIGVYIGANLTQLNSLHTAMDDNNQTNLTLLRPLAILEFQRQQRREKVALTSHTAHEKDESNSNTKANAQEWLHQCKSKLQQMEQQLQECQNTVTTARQAQATPLSDTSVNSLLDDNLHAASSLAKHPVCRYILPQPSPTAMAVWSSQLARIHKASQIPNDHKFVFADFTAELLHLISHRLPRAVKTVPHRWDSVERVLHVGYKRWKYLQQVVSQRNKKLPATPDVDAPRKVNILIMGGSLLVGTNCRKIITEVGIPGVNIPNRHCTWSNRLEKFLNQLLGPIVGVWDKTSSRDYTSVWDLVQVTKTAMGGTNTQTGQVILEYDLLPVEARHADIIINAYSTNDMHILTVLDAAQGNVTLRDKVFEMTQAFVRQVLQERTPDCDSDGDVNDGRNRRHAVAPLLLHMDDYLGNEQREIWATSELSQGVQVLANYYGFTSMSYADVVRDLVYADTHESWFSPSGWYDETSRKNRNLMMREIHPGMGMHITATWVTAFTMLHLATTFCSLEWSVMGNSSLASWHDDSQPFYYDNLLALPKLEGRFKIPGKPRRPPRDLLPPLLTKSLSLENITELWRGQQTSQAASGDAMALSRSCDQQRSVRCPFSWVSSLNQQQKQVAFVREYFANKTISNKGWDLVTDHDKLGYVPVGGPKSSLTLEFQGLSQPIRTVTFFIMKSYGPKWDNSRMQVTVQQGETTLLNKVLEGFHDKHTSETYTEPLQLKNTVTPGSTFQLRMELVEGETFKIMGLAVCS
jgi:hypothetical protein